MSLLKSNNMTNFTQSDDPRVEFANDICKMLIKNSDGHISVAVELADSMYNHFMENVRNFYEVVYEHVPLFFLYELMYTTNVDDEIYSDAGVTKEEGIRQVKKACIEFYDKM